MACRCSPLLLPLLGWSALLLAPMLLVQFANAAIFVDDRGVQHTWDESTKARVAVRAGIGAVSLYHMGMREEQLAATWGLWGVRGSDFDPENPSQGSIYPEADPSPEEAAFLASAVNLSPSCWKNPRGCFQWDDTAEVLGMRDEIDFIVNIDNGSAEDSYNAAEEAGMNVIFIDTFYEYNENCRASNYSIIDTSFCYGRSMIDVAQRIEELAVFLGVEVDQNSLNQQKQAACDAAQAFTETMKDLHDKGIRVKVSIVDTELRDDTGVTTASVADFDPIELWVPRTLEELGMPLLHAASYENNEYGYIYSDEYFPDCTPGFVNDTCNGNTYFPVDFWLIDSRSFILIDDNFKLIFPDRAMLAGQYWSYPRNDGSISYVMIESLLNEYRTRLGSAVKLQDSTGTCTPADPKATAHLVADGTGGLGLNEFICYDEAAIQQEYLQCPTVAPVPPVSTPTSPTPPTANPPVPTSPNTSASSDAIMVSTITSIAAAAVTAFLMFCSTSG
ncbi:hypothetical protein IV203_023296 [Nitzschia inconspicua]|uniref:1,3-beta-glucanosyltransferase n=1 Tax=Nitzschia inconspicua TaxID=303405 RepID=A0A9K3KCZ5_9STRA|nr:hypothetical protein IV203_023296 [Nitzschia inconspicua]